MKKVILAVIIISALNYLAACDNGDDVTGETNQTTDGSIEVELWHSMGGSSGEALQDIADQFNESQNEVYIIPEFQGSYEEAMTTFHSLAGGADAPAIMQMFDVGTMSMINSGHIIPVQQFIDAEGFDISGIEPNIVSYYSIDGQLYSMPFNSSTPVVFFNADAFREAGLDPTTPPATFEEVEAVAQTIVNADIAGMGGFAFNAWGWMWEQHLANQGALLLNYDNGRTGTPTEVGFTWDEGYSILSWIERMVEAGTFVNYGAAANWDNMYAGFFNEDVAMIICSSASVAYIVESADFEVGIAFIPHPEATEREGVVIGGASFWLVDHEDEELHDAAWEFLKYVARPDIQAQWHVATGFLATNPAAYNEQSAISAHEEMPQLRVTVEQLQATTSSYATQGGMMDMIPQYRIIIETALEEVFNGASAESVLEDVIPQLNQAIERANLARED